MKQPEGHKYCSNCESTKLLDEFHKNSAAKDGKQAWCKICIKNCNRAHHLPKVTGFKECITCHEVKPFTVYGVDTRNKDGRKGRCDVCESERNAEWWQARGKKLWAERKRK